MNEKWPWLHAAEKHGSGILLYNTAPKKSAIGHFWIEFLGKAVDSAEKGWRRVTFNVKILAILFKYHIYFSCFHNGDGVKLCSENSSSNIPLL